MNQQLHSELKKEFQLERMIFFSDAVFAIAITILVLEIKVPPIDRHAATDEILLKNLDELVPKFVGFFISFFIIGLYWTIHHRMFGYVVNYTRRLIWLNLIFLLAVVLMPFSTAFYSEFILRLLKTPAIVYVTNIVFLGVMNFVLWTYINNPKHKLADEITEDDKKYFGFRSITVPIVFILMAIVYLFVNKKYAIWIPFLIPLIMRILRKFYFKRNK
ncbi:MAG: TMEM175 family protein [Bacteroidota bacterium]|nr:TMEM175 family protein [Bacteroidota bacterium]